MSNWNFDITQAPKGHYETVTRTIKGKEHAFKKFVPAKIIATDGEIVTVSYWQPNKDNTGGRWVMFATNQMPLALQEWPVPPDAS